MTFFKDHMERNVPVDGASGWEPMMNRDFGSFTYTAWRRILPVRRACLLLLPNISVAYAGRHRVRDFAAQLNGAGGQCIRSHWCRVMLFIAVSHVWRCACWTVRD